MGDQFETDVLKESIKVRGFSNILRHYSSKICEVYGFYTSSEKREFLYLLDDLKKLWGSRKYKEIGRVHKRLLMLDESTKSRLSGYDRFYKKLFEITGKPKVIVELACGINPLSYYFMGLGQIRYIATDVNSTHLEMVKKYFSIIGLNYEVLRVDLSQNIPKLEGDVCFLFEILDLVPLKDLKKVFSRVKARWYVITFPLTVKKDDMRYPRLVRFERYIKMKYKIIQFKTKTEQVFCISNRLKSIKNKSFLKDRKGKLFPTPF